MVQKIIEEKFKKIIPEKLGNVSVNLITKARLPLAHIDRGRKAALQMPIVADPTVHKVYVLRKEKFFKKLKPDTSDRGKFDKHNKPEVTNDGFTVVKRRYKSKRFDNYRIYTISLNKDLPQYKNYNLPSYNKNILNKHLCITYGKDNTGDINNFENIEYIKNISKKPFYLVTADGGFDEGTDFNHKEQLHYQLILNEILAALTMQKTRGHFILKMFDIFF